MTSRDRTRPHGAPRRTGSSLVELLVSLVLLAVGGALLVATRTVQDRLDRRMRQLRAAAALAREQVSVAPAFPCGVDTAGVVRRDGVTLRWGSRPEGPVQRWTDSLLAQDGALAVQTLRVECRG